MIRHGVPKLSSTEKSSNNNKEYDYDEDRTVENTTVEGGLCHISAEWRMEKIFELETRNKFRFHHVKSFLIIYT